MHELPFFPEFYYKGLLLMNSIIFNIENEL